MIKSLSSRLFESGRMEVTCSCQEACTRLFLGSELGLGALDSLSFSDRMIILLVVVEKQKDVDFLHWLH